MTSYVLRHMEYGGEDSFVLVKTCMDEFDSYQTKIFERINKESSDEDFDDDMDVVEVDLDVGIQSPEHAKKKKGKKKKTHDSSCIGLDEKSDESEEETQLTKEISRELRKKSLLAEYEYPEDTWMVPKIKPKDDVYNSDDKRRCKTFMRLCKIILPEQRSDAWFAMREGMITASDLGTALNLNHYEKPFGFIMKKLVEKPFETNEPCHHGKKYEDVACSAYSNRNDVIVREFGLIQHPELKIVGSSPDGICSKYKLDGKTKSKMVGRMLEIKCPWRRKINLTGPIIDHICPIYYWAQTQAQLECCDLDHCDFCQCTISEYESREEFIDDTDHAKPYLSKSKGLEKGCILQLMPKNKTTN